jgi:hypothetical protein
MMQKRQWKRRHGIMPCCTRLETVDYDYLQPTWKVPVTLHVPTMVAWCGAFLNVDLSWLSHIPTTFV